MTCLGHIQLRRHWWGSRCACAAGGYHADALLGLDGALSARLQEHICRLGADVSFAKAREHLAAFLGVSPSTETVRSCCERRAAAMARWQAQETDSAQTFAQAEGGWEFAVDAGKVNTRERGWRDLKIAVVQKRPAGPSAQPDAWQSRDLPAATARMMWADIAASDRFRRTWRPRLRRLGLGAMSGLHVLGDGASWIWKSADGALTGCRQTLDIYHACAHLAAAAKRLYGEETPEAKAFFEQGRGLVLEKGWNGVCDWCAEALARADTPRTRAVVERVTGYFAAHVQRLDYRGRLAAGEAIGSGVVEGAAKTLGLRLKARGARWRHRHARAMAALTCVRQTDQWSHFWQRAA